MRRKPFQEILHPPELRGKGKRRYWLAVGGWFACCLGLLVLSFAIIMAVMYGVERIFGEEFLNAHSLWILCTVIVMIPIAVILGDRLWARLFVKSGYLSDAAVIRIMTNRAPTQTSERRHRAIGSYVLPLLIGGFLAWIAWRDQAYWGVLVSMAFGGWLLVSVRRGWKQSDAIKQGEQTPPDVEKRARDIQKALDERSGKPDNPDEGSHIGQ